MRAGGAQLLALALVGAATLCRLWLGARFAEMPPFALFYPVILVAGLTGGWPSATTALAAAAAIGWRLFMPRDLPVASETVNLLLFLLAGAFMAFAGAHLRALVEGQRASHARLAERELRYRTLFDAISEGFALVAPIRVDGRLVDYIVLEANPAMLRILGVDASMVGRRESEVLRNAPAAWLDACQRALDGEPLTFEYHAPGSQRWFEIHLSRVGDDQLAQFVMEITDRKTAEARQSELFDELNHRVKNNLAIVSAMLSLQARGAPEPQVRDQLGKAVGRIQAMADVHARLYRSSRKDDVDFAVYLDDLCRRLAGSLLEDDRVRIDLTTEPAVMPLDRAVALGLVVNELVTNAAKHAYPAPATGIIAVRLERADRALVLTIADTGQGLPPDTPQSGLGMRLVRSLVQQIGATLAIEAGPGVTFRVRLPDTPPVAFDPPAAQGRLL